MAEHKKFYQLAVYYDIALNRDVSSEVDFIYDVYRRYKSAELSSLLEIGCGPGYHARAFAQRGTRAVGLDLIPEMLKLAREKAIEQGVEVDWLAGDMRSFQLEAPVDVAISMFDSFDALLENDDIIQHFRSVAANLNPHGLYIIDLTHPRECSLTTYSSFNYSGEREGIKVDIVWATNNPKYDLVSAVTDVELEIHVNNNGKEEIIKDSARERFFSPQELSMLAELSAAFDIIAWHGDFDLAQPLDHTPASQRMIAILQKAG